MPSFFDIVIEERIQKAMQEGQFKNLPGDGKPIHLDDYDFLNPDVWMMNKILKNAGYLPPWVELALDIDHDQERLKQSEADYAAWLAATRRTPAAASAAGRATQQARDNAAFQVHLERYVRLAEPLRDKIENFNVMCPIRVLEKVNIWVDHRVEQMEKQYAAVCREAGRGPPAIQAVTRVRRQREKEQDDAALRSRHLLDLVRNTKAIRETRAQAEAVGKPPKGRRPSFHLRSWAR